MLFLREVVEEPKPKKPKKKEKARLLCRQEQLDRVAEMIRGMTDPELITVARTLHEMGMI